MGKRNRTHRADKRRRRSAKGRTASDGGHDGGDDDAMVAERLAACDRDETAAMLGHALETRIASLWDNGWQPADVARLVGRKLGATEAAVARLALASEGSDSAALGRRVAPGWMAQLDDLDARPTDGRRDVREVDGDWADVVVAAIRLAALLDVAPRLPVLTPPPSQWHEAMAVGDMSKLPGALLEKVRNLLAKAESTDFDAEAESFTAKAQEMMARHRIDAAVLAATSHGTDEEPVGRRIGVDDPYAEAKTLLLDRVATANGGRSVWSKELGFTTVFAFADDLDAIEALFTSLLVQAGAALRREGSKHDHRGRSRTTRFRRTFLVAFALRIGERLSAAADASVTDARASNGDAFLPVLVARDDAVRDATESTFPELRHFSPSATDGEGWHKGTRFGDLADVAVGERLDGRAAS